MNVKETVAKLPELFNAKKARGYNRVIQMEVTGPDGGSWYLDVKDQVLKVAEGKAENPRFTLTVSDEAFVSYFNGSERGMDLVRSGKMKFTGPMTEGIAFSAIWILGAKQ